MIANLVEAPFVGSSPCCSAFSVRFCDNMWWHVFNHFDYEKQWFCGTYILRDIHLGTSYSILFISQIIRSPRITCVNRYISNETSKFFLARSAWLRAKIFSALYWKRFCLKICSALTVICSPKLSGYSGKRYTGVFLPSCLFLYASTITVHLLSTVLIFLYAFKQQHNTIYMSYL